MVSIQHVVPWTDGFDYLQLHPCPVHWETFTSEYFTTFITLQFYKLSTRSTLSTMLHVSTCFSTFSAFSFNECTLRYALLAGSTGSLLFFFFFVAKTHWDGFKFRWRVLFYDTRHALEFEWWDQRNLWNIAIRQKKAYSALHSEHQRDTTASWAMVRLSFINIFSTDFSLKSIVRCPPFHHHLYHHIN